MSNAPQDLVTKIGNNYRSFIGEPEENKSINDIREELVNKKTKNVYFYNTKHLIYIAGKDIRQIPSKSIFYMKYATNEIYIVNKKKGQNIKISIDINKLSRNKDGELETVTLDSKIFDLSQPNLLDLPEPSNPKVYTHTPSSRPSRPSRSSSSIKGGKRKTRKIKSRRRMSKKSYFK